MKIKKILAVFGLVCSAISVVIFLNDPDVFIEKWYPLFFVGIILLVGSTGPEINRRL